MGASAVSPSPGGWAVRGLWRRCCYGPDALPSLPGPASALCTRCPAPCLMSIRAAQKSAYRERRARGVCVRCQAPAHGFSMCPRHRRQHNALKQRRRRRRGGGKRDRDRYWRRRAESRCTNCGAPGDPDHSRCRPCRQDQASSSRLLYQSRRARGLCVRCEATSIARAMCEPCSAARRAYFDRRKQRDV